MLSPNLFYTFAKYFSRESMAAIHDEIEKNLASGRVVEALELAEREMGTGKDATLLYLKGKAHIKLGEWQPAMNALLRAKELDPNGAAAQARHMLYDILAFYNKDLYNP